jgi:protein-tyrosine-phosphatase
MSGGGAGLRLQSVLFVCSQNAVRSPMAEALANHYFGRSLYIRSAGVHHGEPDGFTAAALDDIGIDIGRHKPRSLEEMQEYEGLGFDLIITLSPDAHHAALELTRTQAVLVEYWPVPDATITQGSREQRLDAYRDVRDLLTLKIKQRLKNSPLKAA